MTREELVQLVDEAGNLAKVKKVINDLGIAEELDTEGKTKDELKDAIKAYFEDMSDDEFKQFFAEPEDDSEDDPEDNNDDSDNDDYEDDHHAGRNKNKKATKTPEEIVKELMKDPSRDCDNITRTITYLNSLKEVEGEYGDYKLGTLTIDIPIDGFVAEDDGFGNTTWVVGDQTMITFITSSIIATLRNDPELAGVYNKIREDENLLYQVLAGTKVKMLVEYVPANTDWVNPFSRSRRPTVRNYDHDTCIAMIYKIESLGPDAQLWADMSVVGANALSPAVVLAMLEARRKKLRRK